MLSRAYIGATAALLLTGCLGRGRSDPTVTPALTDTVWYVSTRARDSRGRDTRRLADSLEYGMVVSRIESDGDPLVHGLGVAQIDSVRLTSSEFVDAVLARARSAPDSDSLAVLMVHGFGTSLHEAWQYTAEVRARSRSTAPWVAFCWPSSGSGAAWPQPGRIVARAYREDSAAAVASRPAFARAAQALIMALGARHLLVVSHSMGAQLVGEVLAADSVLRATLVEDRLRGLAFVSPDAPRQRFGTLLLPAIRPLARRVVVYASSEDRMLMLSRAINGTERAGLLRDSTAAFNDVETIDTTDGLAAESRTQRVMGTRHPMRRASAALFDLQMVARRYSPECRATLKTAVLQPRGIWRLTGITPPPLSALSVCDREASG